MKKTVVFLCATNGVQSPMAEALLNRLAPEYFDAVSAGLEPVAGHFHALTVKVMEESGFDLRDKVPMSVADLRNKSFDFVITIGDGSRFKTPTIAGTEVVHWEFEDPTKFADPNRQLRAFRTARDQIAQRLNLFVLVQVRPRVTVAAVGQTTRPHTAARSVGFQ